MLDENSILVTYRETRGEPRGSHKKGESWDGRGDCIDCNSCVAVCPMGIDIRDGQQLECINCALCIDACDEIMDRVGLSKGLVAYDTIAGLEAQNTGARKGLNLWRPRTIIYTVLIGIVGLIMLFALASRSETEVNVLRDRNPLYVQLSDGGVRNGYTLKILNKANRTRRFAIAVKGLASAGVSIVGLERATVTVASDRLRALRVFVTVPGAAGRPTVADFEFVVTDLENGEAVTHSTTFRRPEK